RRRPGQNGGPSLRRQQRPRLFRLRRLLRGGKAGGAVRWTDPKKQDVDRRIRLHRHRSGYRREHVWIAFDGVRGRPSEAFRPGFVDYADPIINNFPMKHGFPAAPPGWKGQLLNYLASDIGLERDRSLSIPRVFLRVAEQFKSKPALYEKRNRRYQALSLDELRQSAAAFAAALLNRGLTAQGKGALFLKNSPPWVFPHLAT